MTNGYEWFRSEEATGLTLNRLLLRSGIAHLRNLLVSRLIAFGALRKFDNAVALCTLRVGFGLTPLGLSLVVHVLHERLRLVPNNHLTGFLTSSALQLPEVQGV